VNRLLGLLIPLFLVVVSTSAQPQQHGFPGAPGSMNGERARSLAEPVSFPRRIDLVKMQKDADDLARAAQSIPLDVENVRRGTLPKDVIQKLKQIEKLSKRLRSQISQ